jgi:hypothetical protein
MFDVDRLGHREFLLVSFLLAPGRLRRPTFEWAHNAMTKLGQNVLNFSHHSPPPSPSSLRTNEARVLVELTPLSLLQFGGPAFDEGEHFFGHKLVRRGAGQLGPSVRGSRACAVTSDAALPSGSISPAVWPVTRARAYPSRRRHV